MGKKKCQSNNKNSRSLYLWGEASVHQKWYTILLPPSRTKTRSTPPSPFYCLLFPCLKHSLSRLASWTVSLFHILQPISFLPFLSAAITFTCAIPQSPTSLSISRSLFSPSLCLSLTFPLWPIGNCWAPWWRARVKIKGVLWFYSCHATASHKTGRQAGPEQPYFHGRVSSR